MSSTTCFHCGEPIPADEYRTVHIAGVDQPVCCAGCEAVASLISGAGLDNFYRFRSAPSTRPDDPAAGPDEWDAYDRPKLQQSFVRTLPDGRREAALLIENLTCAACSWLIEHSLLRIDGVASVQVNAATGRALISYDPVGAPLSLILRSLARLGYRPHPVGAGSGSGSAQREQRAALKRLVVAGFGMMQVMMFAVALYFGAFAGMDPLYEQFLRLVSWLVATPVLVYSARPFFQGAWRDLRARRAGMDVPVALGMAIAYAMSIYNTLSHGREVYFDSVTMFVFFLALGRYVEMSARHRAAAATDSLAQLLPATVRRLREDQEEQVALVEVEPGDVLVVRPGETVPADGCISWGHSRLDESMLTGESLPQRRALGERVVAGSLNVANPIRITVEQTGQDTVLSTIGRLLDRAQAERPHLARIADRIAGYFVVVILLIAAGVALAWWGTQPALALSAALAVLVVSCPCALGLATPVALVAASGRLARAGLLVSRGDTLESLAKVTHVVFDKTGTLTEGRISVDTVRTLSDASADECLALAAALERHSEHPIARAFAAAAGIDASAVELHEGSGLEGTVAGRRLRIGEPGFVAALSGAAPSVPADGGSWIALGDTENVLALFRLADRPRPEVPEVLERLRAQGFTLEIASGDRPEAVAALADRLGIAAHHGRMTPADKLARVRELQQAGAVVAVVGDGINDAPVLAGADVSLALGSGTALAQSSAAAVLLGSSLAPLPEGLWVARKTARVIRQNLSWALAYNAVAIPLAATGYLHPWMAAIGMSLSSLLVVLNALRLSRRRATNAACALPVIPTREEMV